LKAAREARAMTQKDVGDLIGVTNRDVSRWENGKVEPGALYRQLLADELFDGDVSRIYVSGEEAA
jgi:transcriptional regulator with XRE-family HTH domain